MKRLRGLCNVLFSLFMVLSLVFQAPTPVSAKADQTEPNQPTLKQVHFQSYPKTATASVAPKTTLDGLHQGPLADTTVTILNESFEGAFPAGNNWTLNDASTTDTGEYLWGPVTRYARTGTHSGWEAAGGANGYDPNTNPKYPNNMNTAMFYGPFSLTDANTAKLTFYYRGTAGSFLEQDGMGVGASIDGTNFMGFTMGTKNNWTMDTLDFGSVDGASTSFLGEPQVWIMFAFQSDSTSNTVDGLYLDDITITKTTSATVICHTLTTTVNPAGAGAITTTPAPNCNNGTQYTEGTVVSLSASANNGYAFTDWAGDVTGSTNPASITMNADHTVTANYTVVPMCYTLTTNVSPTGGGTVAVNPAPNCQNGTKYTTGTSVQITATPTGSYTFANWTGGASGTTNPVTVNVTSDLTVTAVFNPPVTCYTLTTAVSPAGGGSVSVNTPANCNNGTQYTSGTVVQLTATPNSGYNFANWTGGATGTTNPVSVTMSANRSVTANFSQICYTLTTAGNPGAGGTIAASPTPNCNSNTQYTQGTVVQLTATANTGYTFANWTGDATGTSNPVPVTMDGARSVTANFSSPNYTLTLNISPAGAGTITANPLPDVNNGTQYSYNKVVQLTANANTGYQFSNWSDDASGATNPASVTMTVNHTVTANFTQQCFTLAVTPSPADGGTVAANPAPNCNGGTQYTYGTVVQLTATANSEYNFANWTGDAGGTTNPVSVTMNGSHTVTANFSPVCYTLSLTASPSGGGTLSANPTPNCNNNTQYTSGTVVQVTANANTGYQFSSWSGAASGTTNPASVTMSAARSVTATFTQLCYTLTTSVSPAGTGTVAASPAPNCNSGTQYTYGTTVQLTPTANSGYSFANWTGDLTGSANPGSVNMTAAHTVTANFGQLCYTLTTTSNPGGGGSITANPTPNCNNNTQYTAGTVVQLTAVPNSTYTFANWTGAVTGSTNPTSVTMSAARSVTANFSQVCYTLATSVSPAGSGTVGASPAPNCNGGTQYISGTVVQLTGNASTGYNFANWSVDATGTTNPVSVTMSANRSVTANFSLQCFTLTTSVSPAGGGTIAANPTPNCNAGTQYTYGTTVQLTASPNSTYLFNGWSGDATGMSNPVSVTINGDRAATANFTQQCYTLTNSISPTGGGTVTANPTPNCNNGTQYVSGTSVQLTANPATGYAFANWTGNASGTTNPVTVTMSGNRSVMANFTLQCFSLTTAANPANGGSVSADVAPNCNGGTQYTYNTVLHLTASPNTGYNFSGWSGDASGTTNPVTVTMTGARSITAGFTQQCFTLTTASSPAGGGTVTPDTAANCNNGTQYTYGTVVHLTAAPASTYIFSGWTGDFTGTTNPLTVSMTAPRTYTANFTQVCYTLNTAVSPGGAGSVVANPPANCNNGTQYVTGTVVELTAQPAVGYAFANWTGAVTGATNPVSVTMSAARSVTANFSQLCYTLTTAVNPSGTGSVTASPTPNCNANTQYTYGTVVQLTANPSTGYSFANWTGDVTGTANPGSVTMTAAHSVTANFAQQCFSLTTSSNPAAGGDVTADVSPNCNNNTQYIYGTVVQLTATPANTYGFGGWSGSATGVTNPVSVTMTAPRSVTANFSQVCYTLTTAVSPNGTGAVAANPAPNCNNGTQYITGTQVQLTGNPATGYNFASWSGDASGISNPVTVTMLANHLVTANFATCYALDITIQPAGSGQVTPQPSPNCSGGLYVTGTQVQLTASPINGSFFQRWTGDLSGSTNPASILVNANKAVTAVFLPAPELVAPANTVILLDNRPQFSFTAVPGATRYNLQIARTNTFTSMVSNLNLTTNSYLPAAALAIKGTTLYWRVRASSPVSGPWSEVWSFTTANPPLAPALTFPANKALLYSTPVTLDWKDVVMPKGTTFGYYKLEISTDPAFGSLLPGLPDQITISQYALPSALPANGVYYWRVRTFNSLNQYSVWSSVYSFRTAMLPPVLSQPVKDEAVKSPRPSFTWAVSAGALSYNIQISTVDTFKTTVANKTATGASYLPTTDLPKNKPLFWRVRAIGPNGPSLWSEVFNFTSANSPAAPVLVSPAANALLTSYTPKLDWKDVVMPATTTFDHYQVEIAKDAAFTLPVTLDAAASALTASEYVVSPALDPGTLYYWHVRAYNTAGQYSNWSLARTFRTIYLPPTLVSPAPLAQLTDTTPQFDWNATPRALTYTVQVSTVDTFKTLAASGTAKTNTFTLPKALKTGVTYYWRVRVNGTFGPSGWSETRSFTITL